MSYIMIINNILPLVFDYSDNPFELIKSCKTIQNNAYKYGITFNVSYQLGGTYVTDKRGATNILLKWKTRSKNIQINPLILKKYKFKKINMSMKSHADNMIVAK